MWNVKFAKSSRQKLLVKGDFKFRYYGIIDGSGICCWVLNDSFGTQNSY